jgi:2''-5'' RNA ligase
MLRLFFSIWPDEAVRTGLVTVLDQLPRDCGRFIPEHKLHITLVFLGSIETSQADCIIAGARHISLKPITLTLDHTGWWRQSQVIWLAPRELPEELKDLSCRLKTLAAQCGVTTDSRHFHPHITLARKVHKRPLLPETVPPVHWPVKDYCLASSVTDPKGPRYEIVWTSATGVHIPDHK